MPIEAKKVLILVGLTGMAALYGCGGCSKETPPATRTAAVPTATPTAVAPTAALVTGSVADHLIVWADVDPDSGAAPLAVQLTGDLIEEVDRPQYSWDFGDGSPPSNEQNPKHVYQRPGTYTARLKVTDAAGTGGEDTTEIEVEVPELPDAAAPHG